MGNARINRASLLSQIGAYDKAIAEYDIVLQLYPGTPMAVYGKGYAYALQSKWRLALAEYDKAIALSPDFAQALSARAKILAILGRQDEARGSMQAAYRADPQYGPAVMMQQGDDAMRKWDFPAAVKAYEDAAAIAPNEAYTHFALSQAYAAAHKKRHALMALNAAVAKAPHSVNYLMQRAALHRELGDAASAAKDFDRALALEPDNVNAAAGACAARLWQGKDLARAKALCDVAVTGKGQGGGGTGEFNFLRGLVHLKNNDNQAAWADFDTAVTAVSWMPSYRLGRAVAATRKGDRAAARKDFESMGGNTYAAAIFQALGIALPPEAPTLSKALEEAMAALRRQENEKALALFNQMADFNSPDYGAVAYGRSAAAIRLGRRPPNENDLMTANANEPQLAPYFARFGAVATSD